MIWKPCKLFAKVQDDDKTDELGNPVMLDQEIWSGKVVFTPWSDSDLELQGRDVVRNEQLNGRHTAEHQGNHQPVTALGADPRGGV